MRNSAVENTVPILCAAVVLMVWSGPGDASSMGTFPVTEVFEKHELQ